MFCKWIPFCVQIFWESPMYVCVCAWFPKAKRKGDFPHSSEANERDLFLGTINPVGNSCSNWTNRGGDWNRKMGTAVITDTMPFSSPCRFLLRAVQVFFFTCLHGIYILILFPQTSSWPLPHLPQVLPKCNLLTELSLPTPPSKSAMLSSLNGHSPNLPFHVFSW